MTDDPYEDVYASPSGENSITIDEDGNVSAEKKLPDEKSNIWKGSKRISELSDDAIRVIGVRKSGIVDYVIDGVSVIWRGVGNGESRQFVCLKHRVNDCPETRRVARFRSERAA